MPNIGRASRGCYTCRARRIKCDHGKPGCHKCKIFGRPCPGYRDEASLLFRDQNDYAKAKATGETRSTSTAALASYYVATPQSLPLNLEAQCIDQFFSQYIMAEGRTGYGYLDFVPSMCASEDAMPCLRAALPAVALANAANQRNQPELLWRARAKYGQTLGLINKTLQGPPELFANDSVRLTLIVLSIYEMITGEGFAKDLWDSHHDGRMMVMRVQAEHLQSNPDSWNLFRIMHTQVLLGCLLKKCPPPQDSIRWLSVGNLNGPIEKLSIIFVKLVRVVSHVEDVAISWPEPIRTKELRNIAQHGIELDQKLVHWAESLHSTWKYSTIPNHSTSIPLPKAIQVHEDFFTAASWNTWRSIRIRLIQILMAITELTGEDSRDSDFQFMRWRKTLLDLADAVCNTTPYLLGEIDGQGVPRSTAKGIALGGLTLLYPLRMISTIRDLPEHYHHWIGTKLTYIATTHGIGQANIILKFNKMRKNLPIIGDIVPEVERLVRGLKGQK